MAEQQPLRVKLAACGGIDVPRNVNFIEFNLNRRLDKNNTIVIKDPPKSNNFS